MASPFPELSREQLEEMLLKRNDDVARLTAGLESAMASIQQLVELKMIPANNKGLRDGRKALAPHPSNHS